MMCVTEATTRSVWASVLSRQVNTAETLLRRAVSSEGGREPPGVLSGGCADPTETRRACAVATGILSPGLFCLHPHLQDRGHARDPV